MEDMSDQGSTLNAFELGEAPPAAEFSMDTGEQGNAGAQSLMALASIATLQTPGIPSAVMQAPALPDQGPVQANARTAQKPRGPPSAGLAPPGGGSMRLRHDMPLYYGTQPITREVAELQVLIKDDCLRNDPRWGCLTHKLRRADDQFDKQGRLKAASILMPYYFDMRLLSEEEWHAMTIEWNTSPLGYRLQASLSSVLGRTVDYVDPPAGFDPRRPPKLEPMDYPPTQALGAQLPPPAQHLVARLPPPQVVGPRRRGVRAEPRAFQEQGSLFLDPQPNHQRREQSGIPTRQAKGRGRAYTPSPAAMPRSEGEAEIQRQQEMGRKYDFSENAFHRQSAADQAVDLSIFDDAW